MSERWIAIVNPAAGGGRCGKRASAALEELRSAGLDFEVHRTTKPGDATAIARAKAGSGARRFLSVGGDGTSWEVLNGLFPRDDAEDPPTLAMLPLGTGNSFLRDFGITSTAAAMSAILRGRTQPCDLLRVDHQGGVTHSINIVGVGFSAEAGALTNRRYKHLGVPGYVVAVLRTAMGLQAPVFPLRVDGGLLDERPAILLSFCNSRCTAGTMRMAPHAEVADGLLDVIRVGPRSRLGFVSSFPAIFSGRHVRQHGVEEARARRVDFELAGEVDTMIDGEVMRLALRSIEVLPGAVRVVA
ncbi:MAG: diacylglycerol kinase family lipid kinase [Myxococcota bacterium]|nr:diacylglycerol kinase family lipid kinase [Myxococcota bacterium]